MNELTFFDNYDIPVVQIPVDRGYWLVRTNSGEHFEDFYLGSYIGIGWNDFNNPSDFTNSAKEATQQKIEDSIDDVQPWRVFTQIQRFFHGIKNGDIVMIPSKNSKYIVFGEVTSDVYFEPIDHENLDEGECPYEKRRRVKWIKNVDRVSLDPYLYKMMQSHFSISDAKDYADAIDRTLHGFYIKGDKSHLILNVNQPNDIALLDLIDALDAPLVAVDLINEICEETIRFDKKDLDAKIRVQSIGIIELVSTGAAMGLVVAVGVLMVFAAGGKVSYSRKKAGEGENSASLETEGLIEKIIKWKEQSHKQRLETEAMNGDDKKFERFIRLQENISRAEDTLELALPKELTATSDESEIETAVTLDPEQDQQS